MNTEISAFEENDLAKLPMLQPEGWADIRPHFNNYVRANYCAPLKLCVGGRMLAVGAVIRRHDVAWLGHVIVHRDARRRGYGLAIVQALKAVAQRDVCRTLYLIATELGRPVYEKAGFVPEAVYADYGNFSEPPHAASPYLVPYETAHEERLSLLDYEVTQENRMFHLREFMAGAVVYQRAGDLEGYYLPAFGDGLVVAENETAGLELLRLRLQQIGSGAPVSIPNQNLAAIRYLRTLGATTLRTQTRMRYGEAREIRLECVYNRASPSLG